MESRKLIPVYNFCVNHQIEWSFVESLHEYGLIEIITIEEQPYFEEKSLPEVEKFVRLYYELDINLEGIEAIGHLLDKLKEMRNRNIQLQNRLGLYENSSDDL